MCSFTTRDGAEIYCKAELLAQVDLTDVVLVGHCADGGEVALYIGRYGTGRVAKAVLVGAVTPVMLKSAKNPGGMPINAFDQLRAGVHADRPRLWKDLSIPFYGYTRPGAKDSEGVRETFWLQGTMAGMPARYFCINDGAHGCWRNNSTSVE